MPNSPQPTRDTTSPGSVFYVEGSEISPSAGDVRPPVAGYISATRFLEVELREVEVREVEVREAEVRERTVQVEARRSADFAQFTDG